MLLLCARSNFSNTNMYHRIRSVFFHHGSLYHTYSGVYENYDRFITLSFFFYTKADVPTTVGSIVISDMDTGDASTVYTNRIGDKKYYFDTTQIKVPRAEMEMSSFMKDGMGM